MRLNRFGLPPGLMLPTAIYGLVTGMILVLIGPPEWVYYVGSLPYWPWLFHQMDKREREESPRDFSGRKRRSERPLG
jgi:hypothetical protein